MDALCRVLLTAHSKFRSRRSSRCSRRSPHCPPQTPTRWTPPWPRRWLHPLQVGGPFCWHQHFLGFLLHLFFVFIEGEIDFSIGVCAHLLYESSLVAQRAHRATSEKVCHALLEQLVHPCNAFTALVSLNTQERIFALEQNVTCHL